ncbi:asparaginase [Aeromicrobium massiliense]|uniref:asparaginase n=1 Tax=Aeromicrobium massiliense TaxID=1464554 RepID=UPI0002D93485|nr:asparaginase [Aeromicrobium massiliense]
MDVIAEYVRSGLVESRHRGAVVRVERGAATWSVGDPDVVVFPRSANKPIQALGMLRAGLPLDGRLLALASASHSGEDVHLEGVREVLAQAGLDESALQTPPSYPLDPKVHAAWIRAGGERERILMDCSGKHAAMLLTCVQNGWDTATYLDPEHPLQRTITETFTELTGGSPSVVGVDGCGAPLLATSLTSLAAAIGSISGAPEGTLERRLVDALVQNPRYLSGTRRSETAFMAALPGAIAKSGAEAVYVLGLPSGVAYALKVEDGNDRAAALVLARALEVNGEAADGLPGHVEVLGGGRPVGEIRPAF